MSGKSLVNSQQLAKAWVRYNGQTKTIISAYNVKEVIYNGKGDYTVVFNIPFANADFVQSITPEPQSGCNYMVVGSNTGKQLQKTAESSQIVTGFVTGFYGSSEPIDAECVNAIYFGE